MTQLSEIEDSTNAIVDELTVSKDLKKCIVQEDKGLTCLGDDVKTVFVAETRIPTNQGTLLMRAYRSTGSLKGSESIVLVYGDISRSNVFVRVHDQCLTSEVFGSLRCDCKEQLEFSKTFMSQHSGLVIYLSQEGRGIGLANKIKAYSLQELGYDTVDANRMLGFQDDYRSYEPVKSILDDLNVTSIQLLTNNPRKVLLLENMGIQITKRIPIVIPPGLHNKEYLDTKTNRMSHVY